MCHELLHSTYEIDHIVPHAIGGSDDITNLQALNPNCHRKKSQLEQMTIVQAKFWASCADSSTTQCPHCNRIVSKYFRHTCGLYL